MLAILLLLVGCGSPQEGTNGSATPADAPPPPPPRNAHEMAREIVQGEIGVLVHVDRVRKHKLAPRLQTLPGVGDTFEGTGIEPLRDVDRIFVAAKDASDREAVIMVAEHHVPPEKVKAAMQAMVDKSGEDGGFLTDYPVPAARVSVRGRKSVILAVNDTLMVVTSEVYAKGAAVLGKTGGLPMPNGKAAVTARANKPSESLKAKYAPAIPPTIEHATAEVTLGNDGGAFVNVVGQSTSAEQAKADATELTHNLEQAASVKVSVVRIRVFEPIAFHADGDQVKGERKIARSELERLIGLAGMLSGQ